MRLILLGTGTAVPSPLRGSPGAWFETAGTRVLIDPGSGTCSRLARAGVGLDEIDAVLLSHFHVDHVGDLAPLLFALRNPRYDARRRWPRLIGPEGLAEFYDRLRSAHHEWLPEADAEIEIFEVDVSRSDRPLELGDVVVTSFHVKHTDNSLAYRFETADGVLTWSGDTEVCSGIVQAAYQSDLLFLECSFPRDRGVPGHLDPEGVSRVVTESEAQDVVLMHFYPECDEVDLLEQVDPLVRGRIRLGEDLEEYGFSRHL